MISTFDSAALVAAGVIAGVVGSAGGITSLVSYPVLLAVGLPALSANVANNVALDACWPGSAIASQPELHGKTPWLRRWMLVTAAGGAAGAALLLLTPSGLFSRIVPFLIAAGSLALLLEPRLTSWRQRHQGHDRLLALPIGLIAVAGYNGYFGAGAGVMTLTLLLVLVDRHLPTANALKNMLIGSSVGPRLARRLPTRLLRSLIMILGMTLAVQLRLHPNPCVSPLSNCPPANHGGDRSSSRPAGWGPLGSP